jgi:aryl-phospho-beta-D-glucosidase BglC (GH1 family)
MKKVYHFLVLLFLVIPFLLNAQLKPWDAVAQMTRGINIGNTMEAPNEGAWNAAIKEYYFDDLKAAGFNTIRIPMNWWNHTSKTAPYTIDAAWLNRVEQVVDWGLARGLFIVMNTHHETQLFGAFNTYLPMYVSIWSQIATRMKGKSDHLLFELLNEPHGAPTYANMNDFNTKVVKAIRTTNPTRIIVYSGNQWANSYNLINTALVNPAPGDKYLMGYYHSYDPIGFGLSGNGTFGSDADKKGIWDKMQSVADWSTKTGIPAYLGEFGATSSGDLNSRFRYYATNVDYAMTHKIPFMVWDNNGDFQVYNRGARTFNEIKDILIHYYPQSTTNFTVAQAGGVVLKWVNRAANATSILVQRKLTSSNSYITVATIGATATTYTDNSAPAGTYYYRVITNIDPTTQYYGYPQRITTTGGPTFAVSLSSDKSIICSAKTATLTASTVISTGTVTKVDFYEGTTLLASDNTAPYTYTVSNLSIGTHTYIAKATSSTGTIVGSSGVDIVMNNGAVITPYVQLDSGVWANQNTATICSGSSITFGPQPLIETGWSWKGPNGFTATTREFVLAQPTSAKAGVYTATYDDGSGCPGTMNFTVSVTSTSNPVVSSPVSYNLNAVSTPLTATGTALKWYTTAMGGTSIATPTPSTTATGTTSYYVSQTQNGCESARSRIDVVVINTNILPIVSITSPTDSSSYTTPTAITITADASDVDGTIAKVDFYNGASLLGTSITAPYSFIWNNPIAGSYLVTAKATDNNGGVATSYPVSISVITIPDVLPTVVLTAPTITDQYIAPASITITANAGDVDGTIASVQFYQGLKLIGTSTTEPYSIVWNNVAAGNYVVTAQAIDNVGGITISSPVIVNVSPAPNVLPTVSITSPLSNAQFTNLTPITLTATAGDVDGTIASVQFYHDSTLIATTTTAPYSTIWKNVAAGTYTIIAKATDNVGGVTISAPVLVTVVQVPNVLPTVKITAPVASAQFIAPASITLSANAADVDGSIASVQFYNDSTLIATTTAVPYTTIWKNVTPGTYTITAKATDNVGGVMISSPVSVTVVKAPNVLPTVIIKTPVNAAQFTAPASISITANAGDVDGTIAKVDFYNGSTLLGSVTTAPYTFVWSVATVANATNYSITAKATDNAGGITTSAAVSITVNPATTCSFPALTATNWVVRNNWNDHVTNGIVVTADNTGIKVTNRAWGQNYVWLVSTTQYSLKAGVAYTFSYDIQGNVAVAQTELGIATGYQWDGPILSQPTVVAPAGYVLNASNTKTITLTPKVSGNYNVAIKISLLKQPTIVNTYAFKNIKFCTGNNLKSDEISQNDVNETVILGQDSIKQLIVYPNPSSSTTTIVSGTKIKNVTITNVFGVNQQLPIIVYSEYSSSLDFTNVASGIYFITIISSDNSLQTIKFIKE